MLVELVVEFVSPFSLLIEWGVFVIKVYLHILSVKRYCMPSLS